MRARHFIQATLAGTTVAELMTDLHALAERIGSAAGLEALSAPAMAGLAPVADRESLETFLRRYRTEILVPVEMEAIGRAFWHSSRGEARELIEMDGAFPAGRLPEAFRRSSYETGWSQLERLKPLRDERVVQRYCTAVERGEALGWHSLVYGLVLALFSMPLRQGLLQYAERTLDGLLSSAAGRLDLSADERRELLERTLTGMAEEVDRIAGNGAGLSAVS